MIDIANEELITLAVAARKFPSRQPGKRVHISTIWRWATVGVRGVKLTTTRVGGTLYTTISSIQKFSDALSGDTSTASNIISPRTPKCRTLDIAKAEAKCAAAGI